jgi:hypothetical protein
MIWTRRHGVDFSTTATIGRLDLNLKKSELKSNFGYFNEPIDDATLNLLYAQTPTYVEGFLTHLGATDVHSFDNSTYEGATVVHDMNQPIPEQYKNRYSLVIDGGSLEHIFNLPTAMKNCMEMVKVGGHLATLNPCNNFVGHGFYQFSPELFFRAFAPVNGFQIEAAFVLEERPNATWWAVRDPAEVRCRVTLINHYPTNLFVLARKIQRITPFENPPQQSDYFMRWTGQKVPKEGPVTSIRQHLARRLLGSHRHKFLALTPYFIRRMLLPRYNPRFFKAVDLRREK